MGMLATLGHVPSYLADDCRLVTDAGVRRLRSADTRTLVVGRTHQSSFGDRTFATAAPRLWNSLLSDIRQPDMSYGLFRWSLKTFLFGQQGHGAVRPALTVPQKHAYLLTYTYLSVRCVTDYYQHTPYRTTFYTCARHYDLPKQTISHTHTYTLLTYVLYDNLYTPVPLMVVEKKTKQKKTTKQTN